MRCPSCGHENREGAKFCEECAAPAVTAPERDPRAYTPKHLAEKILSARSALEGERKQVTVLFAVNSRMSSFKTVHARRSPSGAWRPSRATAGPCDDDVSAAATTEVLRVQR